MWIDRAIRWLIPKEEHFYDMLEAGAECARRAAAIMAECCSSESSADREVTVAKLHEEEHRADKVIQEIYNALNKTFITPFDRSDIYTLATELENINDILYETSTHIVMYAMDDLPAGSERIAALILDATEEIVNAVKNLRTMRGPADIRRRCKRITEIESEGDKIYRAHIGQLFKTETDAVRLLKNKEFLEGLEDALDCCDDVANSLETIVIKNM